jgi:hypothetical protein
MDAEERERKPGCVQSRVQFENLMLMFMS